MNKKWLMLASMGLAAGLLVLSLALPVLAQDTTPTPSVPKAFGGWGFGFGYGKSWATFDAVAEALGLTPAELFTELHSGKTLDEIAMARGVDLQKVQDAANAARLAERKAAIEQAVKDGAITQEQADWLLQGIEQGWMPMGRGGHGRGPCGPGYFEAAPPSGTTPSVAPSPSSF